MLVLSLWSYWKRNDICFPRINSSLKGSAQIDFRKYRVIFWQKYKFKDTKNNRIIDPYEHCNILKNIEERSRHNIF